MEKILAGSTVLHKPSDEKWLVALDETEGRIYWKGYPFGGYGMACDVELIKPATPEKRKAVLEDVAESKNAVMACRAKNQLEDKKNSYPCFHGPAASVEETQDC